MAVGQVLEVGDAGDPVCLDELLQLGDDTLRADLVGELGDHDGLSAPAHLLDVGPCPDADGSAAGLVGLPDAVVDDYAAAREIGARQDRQQLVDRGPQAPLVHHQGHSGVYLGEVVRRHVGRHAHGYSGRAVDEKSGQQGRQGDGLFGLAVVGGTEVDSVLVEFGDHGHGGLGEPALGVAGRCGRVVERAEVALGVDHGDATGEDLAHAYQGVVDGGVAVRVEAAHRVADHPCALAMWCVRPETHPQHGVEDASLHRLEAVADVGDGPGGDDGEGVRQERLPEFVL